MVVLPASHGSQLSRMDRVFSRTWISPLKKKGYARTASNPSASALIIHIVNLLRRTGEKALEHSNVPSFDLVVASGQRCGAAQGEHASV